jgi:hypothetical protein
MINHLQDSTAGLPRRAQPAYSTTDSTSTPAQLQLRRCTRAPCTTGKLSSQFVRPTAVAAALSQPPLSSFDDLYEYYDPNTEPQLQARLPQSTPLSQRRPPSSSSGSTRSLRRTRRLEERNTSSRRPVFAASKTAARPTRPPFPPASPQRSPQQPHERLPQSPDPLFDNSGSTTPQSFRRIVSQESFWPQRTTHISRRTHEAILFALEAIRTGRGVDYKPLTADTIEENARMSDLPSATQPTGGSQNGSARAGRGALAASADPHRVRTPTDVMRARRDREARRRAEQDARNREAEEQAQQRQDEYVPEMAETSPSQRRPRASTGEQQVPQRVGAGPAPASSGRRPGNVIPPTVPGPARPRANTLDQGPPKPTTQQPGLDSGRGPSGPSPRRPRNDPVDQANIPASQVPQAADQPTQAGASQPPLPSATQPSGRSAFPHAFERWETLSSHWEGLTSYWVRRLQENSNELNDKPLNQQMSRQITDLSAAGANLFHAVVELQRLRASSERKFQRWFFETRQEQERAQEAQAELERLLRVARDERDDALASIATARAERAKAEDIVKEMRRELQICKEEARRSWEELGRREQEERERTISLRNGEPTLVGGVQVVPMTQGVPSRQTSAAHRPTTRDGPYAGGPGPGTMGGQQATRSTPTTTADSPSAEQRQFSYEPQASSPTATDPFTEIAQGSRQVQSQDLNVEHHSSQPQPTQPPSSAAAIAAARTAQAPAAQRPTASSAPSPSRTYAQPTSSAGNGSGARFYQQGSIDTALPNPTTTNGPSSRMPQPARSDTISPHITDPSDQRSYIPSTVSDNESEFGEQEFEINPDGSYRRDAQGRRIPYEAGSAGGRFQSDDGSDEYDVESELERERQYRERYRNLGPSALDPQSATSTRVTPGSVPPPVPSVPAVTQQQQRGPSTSSQTTTAESAGSSQFPDASPADYTGRGWGEGYGPHTHGTRLSDILEERSDSGRASYISGGAGELRGGAGDMMGGFPSSRAPTGRRE